MKQLAYIFAFITTVLMIQCSDILEKDISQEKIVLIAPQDNYTSGDQFVHFYWEAIEGVKVYNVKIVTPSFSSIAEVLLDTVVTETNLQSALPLGKFEWSVTGMNDAYDTKCCSINRLEVKSDSSSDLTTQTVKLLFPADNHFQNEAIALLSWQQLDGAEKYTVQIGNANFSTLYYNSETTATQTSFSLPNDGAYYWRVRGVNESTLTFTPWTLRKLTLDRLAPAAPEIIKPASNDSVFIAISNPDLKWSASNDVFIDSIYIYNNSQKDILLLKLGALSTEMELNGTILDGLSNYQSYYWQIVSFDKAGNTSLPSQLLKFWAK